MNYEPLLRRHPILAAGLVLAALLACKASSKTCRAKLDWQGKSYDGTGKGEQEAKASVCLGWCAHHDPGLEAKWKQWKATPRGAKSKDSRFGEIYSSVPLGKERLNGCKARCLQHIETTQPSPATITCP